MDVAERRKRCDEQLVAPVAQVDKSSSLLRSRLKVRPLPGALGESPRTDSSTAEPPAFNREVAGSSPARCMVDDSSVAQLRQRRLTQNEDVAGSNPARTTERAEGNWFKLALLYAQYFKGW